MAYKLRFYLKFNFQNWFRQNSEVLPLLCFTMFYPVCFPVLLLFRASHYQHIFCAFSFNAVIPKCWLNSIVFFLKNVSIVQLSLSFGVNSTWFQILGLDMLKSHFRDVFSLKHIFTYQHFQYLDFCFPYVCGLNSPHVQPSVAPNNDRHDGGK